MKYTLSTLAVVGCLAATSVGAFEPSGDWNDHAWSFMSTSEKQFRLNQAREIDQMETFGTLGTQNITNQTVNPTTVCEAGGAGAFSGGCASDIGTQNTAIGRQHTTDQSTSVTVEGDNNTVDTVNDNNDSGANNGDVGADGSQTDVTGDNSNVTIE